MSDPLDGVPAEALDQALDESADEAGLPDYYRSCVRPLLRMPTSQWPRCCGGGCEPCSETLRRVASLTLARLGRSVVDR
ncbi:MAG: hypothetical protein KA978_20235 [Deltaproteobacteria bacterium]|nr:hypothetical protein [Deltaproteobacteria bacterium]MBP6833128.1 hypothetical protein [Deltaproteobacteria bacterium]